MVGIVQEAESNGFNLDGNPASLTSEDNRSSSVSILTDFEEGSRGSSSFSSSNLRGAPIPKEAYNYKKQNAVIGQEYW